MSRKMNARNIIFASLLLFVLGIVTAAPALANGTQSGGRSCFGDTAVVRAGETVDSFFALGCNLEIEQGGTVLGDVANFGGNLSIAGTVNGNIGLFGGM